MKGTKEMTKITLYPFERCRVLMELMHAKLQRILTDLGLSFIYQNQGILDPYFRFKLFSSAKFNEKEI